MKKSDIPNDFLISRGKKIRIKKHYLKLNKLNSFKPADCINAVAFKLSENDLNQKNGSKILSFLKKLEENKVKFVLSKPLPNCLFGMKHFEIRKYQMPLNCMECLDFFTVDKNNMIIFCKYLENRMGPDIDYMLNKEQIYDYFKTFYDANEKQEFCKKCVYNIRNSCYTCSRIKTRKSKS